MKVEWRTFSLFLCEKKPWWETGKLFFYFSLQQLFLSFMSNLLAWIWWREIANPCKHDSTSIESHWSRASIIFQDEGAPMENKRSHVALWDIDINGGQKMYQISVLFHSFIRILFLFKLEIQVGMALKIL